MDKPSCEHLCSLLTDTPSLIVTAVMLTALRPLGKEDESGGWAGAKVMLSDTGIVRALQEYKKDLCMLAGLDGVITKDMTVAIESP